MVSTLSYTDQCWESLPGASDVFCVHLCHVNINATALSFAQPNHLTLIVAAILIFSRSWIMLSEPRAFLRAFLQINEINDQICMIKFSFLIIHWSRSLLLSRLCSPFFFYRLAVHSFLSSANRVRRNRIFELTFALFRNSIAELS